MAAVVVVIICALRRGLAGAQTAGKEVGIGFGVGDSRSARAGTRRWLGREIVTWSNCIIELDISIVDGRRRHVMSEHFENGAMLENGFQRHAVHSGSRSSRSEGINS